MHYLHFIALVVIALAHCTHGDGPSNIIKTFLRRSEMDVKGEELIGFDVHELEMAYLVWRPSSSIDRMDVTAVMELNNMGNETRIQRCNLALEIPPGIKNFKSQIGIKALKNSGVVLQWLERSEDPSEFEKLNMLLRYLKLQWFDCKTVRGEIVVDNDESFSSAVANSTNILLHELYGFEILFPRKNLCGGRWCIAGFLGTGLYAPKSLQLAYNPKKFLLRSNEQGKSFWISAGSYPTELWSLNEVTGSLLKDTGMSGNEERISYAVRHGWAAWCSHDSRDPGVSKCSEYYRNDTTVTTNLDLDHSEDVVWVQPYHTLLYKRLYLIALRHLKQETGRCEIVAVKQTDYNGQSFKPLVVYPNIDCEYLRDYETARKRLQIFYESNGGAECVSLIRLERGINLEIKCFSDGSFLKQ